MTNIGTKLPPLVELSQ